ncbi:MAG: ABC transporter ATP-binding protein [Anaerolineae bacterium]|nr:ABC transporter ATP-binding protein [Anaerolineae bacterium]
MAEVRLERIYKTYKGGVEAVKGLDLTIRNGEFLALLGPSGCGKTSTLRMIVGLESITQGNLFIGNRRMNDVEPSERNTALAFESYALYPPLTVYDNIAFCLRARQMEKGEINQRVREVARILEIDDILDRKPAELGGGQKQRISLARALVRDPDVFLMDEPLSHLDAAQRAHMRVELKRLHANTGRTTVLVTHDQLEAVAMAERVAVMNLGVLQQVGSFDDIYNHPVNEFVAGFIGEPPMNFMLCEPISDGGEPGLRATDGSFQIRLPGELKAKLNQNSPRQIKLGIRPIDVIARHQASQNGIAELQGTVHTFEALGEEGQLAAKVGSHEILVVTPAADTFERAQQVWLQFNAQRLHLFHGDTGAAL